MNRNTLVGAVTLVMLGAVGLSAQQNGNWQLVVPKSGSTQSRPVLRVPPGAVTFELNREGRKLLAPNTHQPTPPVFGSSLRVVPIPGGNGSGIDCEMVVVTHKHELLAPTMKVIVPPKDIKHHLKVLTPPACSGR